MKYGDNGFSLPYIYIYIIIILQENYQPMRMLCNEYTSEWKFNPLVEEVTRIDSLHVITNFILDKEGICLKGVYTTTFQTLL